MFRMKYFIVAVVVVSCIGVEAQTKKDILKDAVDPLNLSKQRIGFLRVAGVDSVIDEGEFTKDLEGKKLFARVYDRWVTALRYDKDKSRTLDWFEALAYRQALRRTVLAKYDVNKDKKLKGEEREKAIKDMKKKGVKISDGKGRDKAKVPSGRKSDDAKMKNSKHEAAQRQRHKEHMEKYDTNKDGEIDKGETGRMLKLQAEERRKRREEKMDTNKDGVVTLEERRTAKYNDFEDGRASAIKQFDTDGDGKLNQQEIIYANDMFRQNMEKNQRKNIVRIFDEDRNRKLSEGEKVAYDEYKSELEALKRKRIAELLPTYDVNKNGKLDSIEAFKFFLDNENEKIVKEHNGETPDRSQYMTDGKWDDKKQMKSADSINGMVFMENINIGEIVSMPVKDSEKLFEKGKQRQANLERAARAREKNIKRQLNRKRK